MRMANLKVIVIDNESMVEYFNPMLVARIYEHATDKESRVHIGNKSYRLAMPISEAVAELNAAMNYLPDEIGLEHEIRSACGRLCKCTDGTCPACMVYSDVFQIEIDNPDRDGW